MGVVALLLAALFSLGEGNISVQSVKLSSEGSFFFLFFSFLFLSFFFPFLSPFLFPFLCPSHPP